MSTTYQRWVHLVAVLLALLVFPLIWVGAGVTSKDAGMAYPDWPTSNGAVINPQGWWGVEATRWEHGHRLIGWCVGIFAMLSAALAWKCGGHRRWLAITVLLGISLQGIMGGLRVREISTELAMVHGVWGQICFCLACVAALVSSRSWLEGRQSLPVAGGRLLRRLCLLTTAALLLQLVLGAALRHFNAESALAAHLLWAVVCALLVGWVVLWVIGQHPGRDLLETLGWLLGGLMVFQLLLGGIALIVTYMTPGSKGVLYWAVPSAHVAVGALLLACSVLLTMTAYRRIRPAERFVPHSSTPSAVVS